VGLAARNYNTLTSRGSGMPLIRQADRTRKGEDEETTKERGGNDKEREEECASEVPREEKGRSPGWRASHEGRSYKAPAATDGCGFVSGSYHKP